MAKQVIAPVLGLRTAPNRLTLPPGALTEATDIVIRRPGVAETRRGFEANSGQWNSASAADSIRVWQSGALLYVVRHAGTTISYAGVSSYDSWTDVSGTYTSPDTTYAVTRLEEAKKNLYITSSAGVYRLDLVASTPVVAGVQRPLAITTASAGAGTAVVDLSARAYRAVLKFTDANGNVHRSAPSGRAVFRNSSGGTVNVTVTVKIPASLSTSYVVELYASAGTSSATEEPSDEMGLVYETFLESAEVSAKSIDIADVVPDAMRGATGYFCPSQEGIVAGNERPPLAWDVAWHKDSMFYAATTGKHRLTLRLMNTSGSASSTALEADDTVTIAGVTYTAKASPANESQFSLVTSSTQQVNVRETVLSLVAKINAHSSNSTVYAYYMSGPDDPAGIFMVEERGLGGNSFAAVSSVAAAWTPELPSGGTTISSAADVTPNRVYWSKPGQPEAVPLLNYVDVGTQRDPILRMASVRDSLFVFKELDGVFRITGSGGIFSVQVFDPTVTVHAARTVATLNNEVYALSTLGVVAVSDAGARLVSTPIDDVMLPLSVGTTRAQMYSKGHAVANQADGFYILWVCNSSGTITGGYSYAPGTDAWTKTSITAAAAAYYQVAGRLIYGIAGERTVHDERKAVADADYQDGYNSGTVAVSPAITWNIALADSPATQKQWTRADFLLGGSGNTITAATAGFATDLDTSEEQVSLTLSSGASFAVAPVPTAKQLGTNLTVSLDVSQSQKKLLLTGLVLTYEEGGDSAGR